MTEKELEIIVSMMKSMFWKGAHMGLDQGVDLPNSRKITHQDVNNAISLTLEKYKDEFTIIDLERQLKAKDD